MKNNIFFVIVISILFCFSCSTEIEYDAFDYNLFGSKSRNNSYEQYGNFPIQIASLERIASSDSSFGSISTALRLRSPYYILALNNGKIVRVNNSSTDREFMADSGFVVSAGMTADKNSNIYFITYDDKIYSLDFDLKLRWKKEIPLQKSRSLTFSDLLAVDDGIIIAANTGDVFKYGFDGNVIWKYKSYLSSPKTFCSDKLGNIYISFTNNEYGKSDTLISLTKNGTELWRFALPNLRVLTATSLMKGKIYLSGGVDKDGEKVGITYCIDTTGKLLWKSEHTLPGRNITVDHKENVYIATNSSGVGEIKTGVLSLDKNGKERWSLYFGAAIVSQILVSEKYIGFTGITGDGAAMLFMRKSDGLLVKNHSLSNYPTLYLQPVVFDDASIKIFGSKKLIAVKFSETLLEKILP